ncbi:DUF2958 domain-containing protein [Sulfuricurvum sp.]|uniref:DUF2958 domain-containing protein n=1 Tax=Sulfuricurvum sp. TaxID=2025608 RepID=UPI003562C70A
MISEKNLPGQLRAVQGKIARKRREIEAFERQHEQDGWDGREDLQGYESMSNTLNSELNALESEYKEILAKMRKQRPSNYFTNCENPKKKLAILTPEEDKDWENAYISNLEEGLDDDEADESAWTELKEMHPRLQEFDGINEKATQKALKSNPNRVDEATRLGTKAFHDGKRRVPLYDNDLMLMLDLRNQPGDSDNLELLSAWAKGWDNANLSQPISNPTIKQWPVITAPDGKHYQVYVKRYGSGRESGEGEDDTQYPYAVMVKFIELDEGRQIYEEWTTYSNKADAIAEAERLSKRIETRGSPWDNEVTQAECGCGDDPEHPLRSFCAVHGERRNPIQLPPKHRPGPGGYVDFPHDYDKEVHSDTSDRTYMVRKRGDNWTCTCPSFIFNKKDPRTCKHIEREKEAGYQEPETTPNTWNDLSVSERVTIVRREFPNLGPDGVINLANTKWDNIPEQKRGILSTSTRTNPGMKYSITYFDPETDEGQEKTWTFNTIHEAKEFQKDLASFWRTAKSKIPINQSNPGYRIASTKPGTIEDLMLHRAVIEEVTRRPYRVDKEMGKRLINPKQRAPDPTSMKDVRDRLTSKGPQNFSLKRVVEGQEAQGILEAIVMDLYGGIPLIGDANDLIRTTRIIKTTGSPLKAQIHSIDTLLGTEGIPLVDMIPIVGGLLSKGGGEIADFLLPANTIGFIIEPPQENPLTASELLAGLTAAGIVTGIAMGGASAIGSQLIDRGMKGVEKELKKNPARKGRAAYYRWGEFSNYEDFDMKELDSMEVLDENQMLSMNVKDDHEGWTFYAYESDIDENADGVSVKNAYAFRNLSHKNPAPLVVHGAAIAAPYVAKAAKPHAKKATRELKKRAKKFPLSNPPKLPAKERYEPGVMQRKDTKPSIITTQSGQEFKLDYGLAYRSIPLLVKKFMPPVQQRIVQENIEEFQDVLKRLLKQITDCPSTGQTEGTDDPIAYLHYFYGNADWYIIEKDMEEEQHQAFGYADLGMGFPELGYISIEEIKETNKVELDFHWKPIPLSNIKEKHEARVNLRPNVDIFGPILEAALNKTGEVTSGHATEEWAKEEAKIKNPLTRVEKAENGIRDMFLDRHYSGTVPRTDIKTILSSARWQRYYGPGNVNTAWKKLVREGYVHKSGDNWVWGVNNPGILFPIFTGVVSGVTGVIASAIITDQLKKHNKKRQNPEPINVKVGDLVTFEEGYYDVDAVTYIAHPEQLVKGQRARPGYYLMLSPRDFGEYFDEYAEEPGGWVSAKKVKVIKSNPEKNPKADYSNKKKFPTERLVSYMSFYERMLPQLSGSPYIEERKLGQEYYRNLSAIYEEIERRGRSRGHTKGKRARGKGTPVPNPKVAIEQYKAFQQMDPKNSVQGGKIADMISPVTIIGQIKHIVYWCSKWAGKEFEKRENENVQYIHTWKKSRMDLCRDGNGDYFISGKCQIEPRGIDDWDKKIDWSDSKIDYPKTAKNYAFLGVLKEIAVLDGDIYTMRNALLCGRRNHLYIAYVSPSVFEKIKKEYKLK